MTRQCYGISPSYDVAEIIPPGGVESPGLDYFGERQLPKVA